MVPECIVRSIGVHYHAVISPNFKTVLMKHPVVEGSKVMPVQHRAIGTGVECMLGFFHFCMAKRAEASVQILLSDDS